MNWCSLGHIPIVETPVRGDGDDRGGFGGTTDERHGFSDSDMVRTPHSAGCSHWRGGNYGCVCD